MTDKKRGIIFTAGIFMACFFFCIMAAFASYRWNERLFYNKMAAVASVLPKEQGAVIKALKDMKECDLLAGKEILNRYGYDGYLPGNTFFRYLPGSLFFACLGAAGIGFWLRGERKKLRNRTEKLTEYLRQVEGGNDAFLFEEKQDVFSHLEDEIYKTVLALRESREQLKQEKENLARNLADISHQLKTPLTSLSVLGELLRRRVAGREEELTLADKMERQTDRLSALTAALLTLARADAGVLAFEMRSIPISELLAASLEPLGPLLEEKGQQVKIYGEEDIFLSCDLGWTKEALGNLIKNASEHSLEGSEICVRLWENPIYTAIAIEDEGGGFSRKDLPHLFERFYRGEGTGKEGTGIGLSLAKSLIESQNGEIRAENRKEGGARFLVRFYKGNSSSEGREEI